MCLGECHDLYSSDGVVSIVCEKFDAGHGAADNELCRRRKGRTHREAGNAEEN